MSDADTVLVERDGPVTIISINRPHNRNAVDGATARKLYDAENADPGSGQPRTAGTSRMCAVDEIGNSSVIPCRTPSAATFP